MKKLIKIIIIFLVVLLMIGAGAFFYYFSYYKKLNLALMFVSKPSIEPLINNQKIGEENQRETRGVCLTDDEIADYPLDEKSNPILKIPKETPVVISIRNSKTQQEKFKFEISDINIGHYHPVELHKCGAYVIREFNYDYKRSKPLTDFKMEIWRYRYDGSGEKLMEAYDFRIDPSEKYIVLEESYLGKEDYALVIKDLNTKEDVFILPTQSIVKQYPTIIGSFDMRGWTKDGKYFWGDIFDGADVLAFFRINAETWKWELFEVPVGTMGGTALSSEFGYITYDDGPPWTGDAESDQINKEKWQKEGKKLNFYLYNLFTQKQILLETVDDPLWSFKPQWLSDTELEYILPNGEKKVYKINQ